MQSVGKESLRELRICASACRWHFVNDCIVTQTGIITHFHASFLPPRNVTPCWVSFRFASLLPAALSFFLTLPGHYHLLSIFLIFVFISLPFPFSTLALGTHNILSLSSFISPSCTLSLCGARLHRGLLLKLAEFECTFESMNTSGDTFWSWSAEAKSVTDCRLTAV